MDLEQKDKQNEVDFKISKFWTKSRVGESHKTIQNSLIIV